ncbi:MAG: family 16 glycosylhydrolase [Candidatus Thiodiazotropha taylori]|nr:family 16 glycosylhydrolase [Candidatus Thiodiazotropha taylori]
MNIINPSNHLLKFIYKAVLSTRKLLGKSKCEVFSKAKLGYSLSSISNIYVINLDRSPKRWKKIQRELSQVIDGNSETLTSYATRVSAVDALNFDSFSDTKAVNDIYALADQLYVDPRSVLPPGVDLEHQIKMSRQEIAITLSHIKTWEMIASGSDNYVLVIEDDVCLKPGFSSHVKKVWSELNSLDSNEALFDVLYLSYKEVNFGAEKARLTKNTFRLFRGVWFLSGYVLSKRGANRLLSQLPVQGPVDLWMNHKFDKIDAVLSSKSVISQRMDEKSENYYSALPALSKIGVLNTEAPGVFKSNLSIKPIFVIGDKNSGLTSMSMALSMLGYRCCSDLNKLPDQEQKRLISKDSKRIFNAYINVGSVEENITGLANLYPESRLIILSAEPENEHINRLQKAWRGRVLVFDSKVISRWKDVCEFLCIAPPVSPFPELKDLGQRTLRLKEENTLDYEPLPYQRMKADPSPWIVPFEKEYFGMPTILSGSNHKLSNEIIDEFQNLNTAIWDLRNDTFPGNLALFTPSNFEEGRREGGRVTIRSEDMGVRDYSSAALTSKENFLFGRFDAVLKPPRANGVIAGIFLHRDTPRQEIDIEFLGNNPAKLLVNVYYNPGVDKARFDYGYRGTPVLVDLGFDASEDFHKYSIEWRPEEIRWYVDDKLIHKRYNWEPTPIPHLPMRFHINLWPSMARDLVGRIDKDHFPVSVDIQSVSLSVESESTDTEDFSGQQEA